MSYYPDPLTESSPGRRSFGSCGSVFGRGRSLLFIICTLIGLNGVFSSNRPFEPGVVQRMVSPSLTNSIAQVAYQAWPQQQPVQYQYPSVPFPQNQYPLVPYAPVQYVPIAYQQATRSAIGLPTPQVAIRQAPRVDRPVLVPTYRQPDANQVSSVSVATTATNLQQLIATHGAALDDSRAAVVRSVGQRLVNSNSFPVSVRFDVLADESLAAAYALESGNVLLTARAVDQMRAQDKIAAVLARQLEYFLTSRGTAQAGAAENFLRNAGFSVELLPEVDLRLAEWRRSSGQQQTVLATYVSPY